MVQVLYERSLHHNQTIRMWSLVTIRSFESDTVKPTMFYRTSISYQSIKLPTKKEGLSKVSKEFHQAAKI